MHSVLLVKPLNIPLFFLLILSSTLRAEDANDKNKSRDKETQKRAILIEKFLNENRIQWGEEKKGMSLGIYIPHLDESGKEYPFFILVIKNNAYDQLINVLYPHERFAFGRLTAKNNSKVDIKKQRIKLKNERNWGSNPAAFAKFKKGTCYVYKIHKSLLNLYINDKSKQTTFFYAYTHSYMSKQKQYVQLYSAIVDQYIFKDISYFSDENKADNCQMFYYVKRPDGKYQNADIPGLEELDWEEIKKDAAKNGILLQTGVKF